MTEKYLFTSESVCEGHPDKVSDQISDAVLDAIIAKDRNARVDCETLIMQGTVIVTGQITTSAYVNIKQIVRDVLRDIGFNNGKDGLDWETCGVLVSIEEQSPDISMGVNRPPEEMGAGDQGCLRKNTLVRTRRGYVPIEDVQAGEQVITHLGPRSVTAARKTGIKKLVGVTLENGMHVECTPDHQLLCYDKQANVYWREAKFLTHQDFVCTLKPPGVFADDLVSSHVDRTQFFTKYNHRVYGPETVVLNKGVGYLMGETIGDGNLTRKSSIRISFGDNSRHLPLVKRIADEEMAGMWRTSREKNEFFLTSTSVVMRKHFENLGARYGKAPEKCTPLSILISPRDIVIAYLRGLFDSDSTIVVGTGRKGRNIRVRLGSSSLRLLRETQLLLNEFGIKSSIVFNSKKGSPVGTGKNYESKHDGYVLSLTGFESYVRFLRIIGFSDPKKARRARLASVYYSQKPANSRGLFLVPHPSKDELIDESRLGARLPFSVSRFKERTVIGEDEVFDLEVESLNLFSANGILVHNSVFGYASRETPELMPLPITLAHKVVKRLADARKNGTVPYLRPDGKSQVTVEYENGVPRRVDTVVVAAQHRDEVTEEKVRQDVIEHVIGPVIPRSLLDSSTKFLVNSTGRFVIGGTLADSGLTGRKIIVDTYGGVGSHGGGCLSGKDPTKVDRSGSYMARYIAKNIVAAGLADKCQVQIAYAIGVAKPVSFMVDTFGTGKLPDEKIEEAAEGIFDMRPGLIIRNLDLLRPIYRKTACYGHFGRDDPDFTWERTDKTDELRRRVEVA